MRVANLLAARNWVTFVELEDATGLSRSELIAIKADVESELQRTSPGTTLVSRVDLRPEGFEVTS
jgi:hypothetical protein